MVALSTRTLAHYCCHCIVLARPLQEQRQYKETQKGVLHSQTAESKAY